MPQSRRRYLKRLGTFGGAGALGTFAGCTSGGEQTDAKTKTPAKNEEITAGEKTKAKEKPVVKMTTFPINVTGLTLLHLEKSGILKQEMEKAGYDYNLQFTFKGAPLYASGKTDIAFDVSTLGAARMGGKQDINTTIFGRMATNFLGPYVKAGSKWSPSKTGSIGGTVDKIAKQNAPFGIFGWSVGNVPVDQILLQKVFGQKMRKQGGDFKVITAKPPAVPKLLRKNRLAMATSSPSHGVADEMMKGELRPLYFGSDLMAQKGLGTPPLANIAARDKYFEEHPDAVRAVLRAWDKGTDWFYEKGPKEIPKTKAYRKKIGAETPETADYIMNWMLKEKPDVKFGYKTDTPRLWREVALDDTWIQNNKKFMELANQLGQVPSDWKEFVTYKKLDIGNA